MARHLVKRQVANARGKLLASKGHKNRKQVQQVVEEEPEEVSDNEVEVQDNVENKGGRSPRRAALEAAKKIYCTARNYKKNDDGGECSYRPRSRARKSSSAPKKLQIIYDLQESEPDDNEGADLLLECEEDMLSEAQMKVIKRQHKAHNDAMKKIRDANEANERFFRAQIEFFKLCESMSTQN